MEVDKKEGNMRLEYSVMVPSSCSGAVLFSNCYCCRVLGRLMLNLNVVTVIAISHVLNRRIRVRSRHDFLLEWLLVITILVSIDALMSISCSWDLLLATGMLSRVSRGTLFQ